MKRNVLIILGFMLMGMFSFAQNEVEASKTAPVMTFDVKYLKNNRMVHDYGTINKGADGQCYFVFTNTGKEPIIIEKATSSCGCTVPNPPMYPILPGQSDSISVKYDTKRVGPINKVINVISNAANSPVSLYITGNIVDPETSPAIPENRTGNSVLRQDNN